MSDISIPQAINKLQIIKNISQDEALTLFAELVKLNMIDDVLDDILTMEKEYYLEQHPYEIYYSEHDKRYRTYLPPKKDGERRKPITAVTKENLENKIVAYYKQMEEKTSVVDTFEKLYPLFLDYKGKETSLANAHKLNWVWETYYKDNDIVKCKFSEITVVMLKNWFLDKIAEHKLTSRKYKEMKSLMNMLYDFAIESDLTSRNVSRMVHGISYKKYTVEQKKAPTEQVYINDEEENIINRSSPYLSKTASTDCSARWAIKSWAHWA